MAIALNHSRAKGAAKLILIGIANHDGDGGAWPSVATLSRYGQVTPRQTQKLIGELERLGEITRHQNAGGNHLTTEHLRPNLYHFKLQCPPSCDRSSRHRTKNDHLILELSTGVSPTTPGVAHDRGGVSPTTPEPSMNQPQEIKERTSPIARTREGGQSLYSALIEAKCSGSRNGRHVYEDSGYCRWCADRRPDPYINPATGEIA